MTLTINPEWTKVRHVRLAYNPEFELELWDMHERVRHGRVLCQRKMAYRFTQAGRTLFEGDDYGCAPSDAVDSDDAVRGILAFLTLRPGDTDDEYFEAYTPEQLDFAETHGEELQLYSVEPDGDNGPFPIEDVQGGSDANRA